LIKAMSTRIARLLFWFFTGVAIAVAIAAFAKSSVPTLGGLVVAAFLWILGWMIRYILEGRQ
jgi:hypothetical protein